jgi:hypothetical protein
MLQQGNFVADVVYYYGEDSNITALFGANMFNPNPDLKPPDIPDGYNFDYANSDVVQSRLAVNSGRLTTASGMSYRLLAIDRNAVHMPLPVLRKIRELVMAGATVVGPKPVDSPSLSDDQDEVKKLTTELWGSGTGERTVGKGKVFAGMKVGDALAALQLSPDFEYAKPQSDSAVLFVHRKLGDGEVYWINNRKNRAEAIEATFRVTGKAPELWHADTGQVEPAAYRTAGGRTMVPFKMDPNDAVFVVFRKTAATPSRTLPPRTETSLETVDGPWEIAFQPDRGAPATITLNKLTSWSENADTGVKYFSGTGTYSKTIQAPADWFKGGAELWLDLGDVKNLAEVSVNGQAVGVLWKPPFRANVTRALKAGSNTIQIKVTNLWVNRLIGDEQPNAVRHAYTSARFYRQSSPLLQSGLLGPVNVIGITAK